MTTGWKLDRKLRESLLEQLPPRYPEVIADHVTLDAKAIDVEPPPVSSARIVGRADENRGVEAMVVELEGSLDRPDGSTWHVTWSLGPGRTARESNDVIAAQGFVPIEPVALKLRPAIW